VFTTSPALKTIGQVRQLADCVLPGSVTHCIVSVNHEIALPYLLEDKAGSCISIAIPGRARLEPETQLPHDGRGITVTTSNVCIADADGGNDVP
jgi:hypothetical protein